MNSEEVKEVVIPSLVEESKVLRPLRFGGGDVIFVECVRDISILSLHPRGK